MTNKKASTKSESESDLDSICISCDVLFPLKLVRNFPTKLFCINKGLFLSKFPSIADYPDCSPVLPSSYQKNKTNISLVQGEIFKISTLISRYSISLLSRETTLKKSLETACAQSPKEDFGTSLKIRTIPALQRSTCSFANNRVRKTYLNVYSWYLELWRHFKCQLASK